MGIEYEYKLISGFMIFYAIIFIILGQMGIASAQALDYDNVNTFTGVKAMLDKDIASDGVVNLLFTIIIGAPLAVILTMIGLNAIRGR